MAPMSGSNGLSLVKEIYQNRDKRAKDLKAQGSKIIGYFCCHPPLELLTAADMIPYRITGQVREPVTLADAYIETVVCPYMRSCFDMAMKGRYDFLDGLVFPHTCDPVEKAHHVWRYYLKPAYFHYINVPHMVHPPSYGFFKAELRAFKKSIEQYSGSEVSDMSLREAIDLHNENRALVRELYELRKKDPPLLSGTEMTQIIVAAMSIPVTECNHLLASVIDEVKNRKHLPQRREARVLVYGSEIDDIAFIQLIEECGASVVVDDLCLGTRYYWYDVERTDDPLDGLATRYLDKIPCPRTYKDFPGTRRADLDNRFRYLLNFARDFSVNGVILYIIRFCDTHEFDVPDVIDYLRDAGLNVLHLEDDYSLGTMMQLRTRIQAFLEMIATGC